MKYLFLALTFLISLTAFAGSAKYEIQVDGMVCSSCIESITQACEKVSGVKSVQVNLKKGTAEVISQDGKQVSETALKEAIEKAGYTVKSIRKGS